VPLHCANEKIRGFNQATLLAEELGQRIDRPVAHNLLVRTKRTLPQYKLHKIDRRENVAGAFALGGSKTAFQGQNVLLIDDVCTTGATLQACAKVLRRAGARSVQAFVLARDE
jgi:ComF family protein